MDVSEIAKRAAVLILPDHYHVEEDCWLSCPQHPGNCCSGDKGTDCNCDLEGRRGRVAEIVQAAIDETLNGIVFNTGRTAQTT